MSAIPLPPESVMQTPKSNNAAPQPFSSIGHSGRSPRGDRLEGAGLEPQANLACLRSHMRLETAYGRVVPTSRGLLKG